MSSGHGGADALYVEGDTPVHRLPPQCKVAASVAFVLAVVATPREAFVAYALYALALLTVARLARVPVPLLARRLVIEIPFLLFALALPLIGGGARIDVAGVALSTEGLWVAFNIVVKGTLGVATTVLLASTTTVADILRGLEALKVPKVVVAIAGFMVRYAGVITSEMRRMKIARESRGYDPRWLWQARAVASSAGALFIRSYERGERVYLSMLSRGFDGSLPAVSHTGASVRGWLTAAALPAFGAAVALIAWGMR